MSTPRSRAWHLRRSIWRDTRNVFRYGVSAPRWAELVWIDPSTSTRYVSSHNRSFTGQVIGGDWDLHAKPLGEHEKFVACHEHWVEGKSWSDTGIYDLMLDEIARHGSKDGLRTTEEIDERYRHLDDIYSSVRDAGRLKTRQEIDPRTFRELGGIYVHIGRDGELIFGNGGCHRLAIAQVLGLDRAPAQIGVVHEAAITTWRDSLLRY